MHFAGAPAIVLGCVNNGERRGFEFRQFFGGIAADAVIGASASDFAVAALAGLERDAHKAGAVELLLVQRAECVCVLIAQGEPHHGHRVHRATFGLVGDGRCRVLCASCFAGQGSGKGQRGFADPFAGVDKTCVARWRDSGAFYGALALRGEADAAQGASEASCLKTAGARKGVSGLIASHIQLAHFETKGMHRPILRFSIGGLGDLDCGTEQQWGEKTAGAG